MLLGHTLSNGALFYPSQGGWYRAEGCIGLPGPPLYFFTNFVGGSFSGTLSDINERINHWLWRRSISPHRYTVGGTWRGSLHGAFEGNLNYQGMCLRRL